MDWLDGYYDNKAVVRLVYFDGTNFRDYLGNAISVSGSGESNTASNVGAGGVGVFNDKVGVDLQFRNIIGGSSKVTVTLNDPNDEIEIDIAEAELDLTNFGGAIDLGGPQASGTIAAARMPAFTGDVTSLAGDSALSIANDSLTNAKLADMATNTVKVNATGGSANPTDLAMATSTVLGRGPTGNIDDLAVNSTLAISDTGLGRATISGDVTVSAGSNTSSIGTDKVVTVMVLNDNITDAKLADMATATVKGNPTGSTADPQNMTLLGSLSVVTGAPGKLKGKGSIQFPYVFSSNTAEANPGATFIRMNSATLGSVTEIYINPTDVESRNISALLDLVTNGWQLRWMSNNGTTNASYGYFDITAVVNNSDVYWSIAGTMQAIGAVPTAADEILIDFLRPSGGISTDDVLAMKVVRTDDDGLLIDYQGNGLGAAPSVADQAALLALDPAVLENYAYVVENMWRAVFVSNGIVFGPLNGQHILESSLGVGRTYVVPDAVTWTASNSGGKVLLTTVGAAPHGITEALGEGNWMQLLSFAGTGWVLGDHQITAATGIPSPTTVLLTTDWVAGMGAPVFARKGTVGNEATSEIILKLLDLPVLRANSSLICEALIEFSDSADATGSRRTSAYIGATKLNTNAVGTANSKNVTYKWGFSNNNSTSAQRGICGETSTGFNSSTAAVLEATEDTSVAGVDYTIRALINVAGMTVRLAKFDFIIRN